MRHGRTKPSRSSAGAQNKRDLHVRQASTHAATCQTSHVDTSSSRPTVLLRASRSCPGQRTAESGSAQHGARPIDRRGASADWPLHPSPSVCLAGPSGRCWIQGHTHSPIETNQLPSRRPVQSTSAKIALALRQPDWLALGLGLCGMAKILPTSPSQRGFDAHCRMQCHLTLSSPVLSNDYTSRCSGPYWSNSPVLIFDIWALWRSGLSGVVILSICLSHACIVAKLNDALQILFIPHERAITLLLWYQEWLVGDGPFPLKSALKVTHPVSYTHLTLPTNREV